MINNNNNRSKKLLLTKKHLDRLFKICLERETVSFIANFLNLDSQLISSYFKRGEELYRAYSELLEENGFLNIDIFDYEDEFEELEETIKMDFLEKFHFEEISVANQLIYDEYLKYKRAFYIEENRYRLEWDIITKIKFVDNPILNNNISLLIMAYKIYNRALATKGSIEYLESIIRHSKTSRNVKLSENRLRKLYKDDFVEEIIPNQNNNAKISMFDEMLEFERSKQKIMITDDIIDVEVKQIEKKDS